MYIITYKDGVIFNGGEPENSRWNDIEQKSIQKIEYTLGNKTIVMSGYEMYNHIYEDGDICQGGDILSKKVLLNVVIMGLSGKLVTGVVFNLQKKRIESFQSPLGKEWNGGLTLGWKPGIPDGRPKYDIK